MEECSEWVELANTGTLVTYTTVRMQHPTLSPLPLPYGYGTHSCLRAPPWRPSSGRSAKPGSWT
jgi:hypothetical protein